MTHILALDTTSKHTSISLANEENILFEYNFISNNRLSASLIPAIDLLFKESGLTLNDISVFGITIGPGLFTGIRVGLTTLKGLLFATAKPVVPVMTLKAHAYKYINRKKEMLIFPLIDARRDEVYVAGYRLAYGKIKEALPANLVPIKKLAKELDSFNSNDFYFTGSGAYVYQAYIEENFKRGEVISGSSFLAPEICKIAFREYLARNVIEDLQQLSPFYIRKPDAEQNFPGLEKHHQRRIKKS